MHDKHPADNDGDTPLHLAVLFGHLDICISIIVSRNILNENRIIIENIKNNLFKNVLKRKCKASSMTPVGERARVRKVGKNDNRYLVKSAVKTSSDPDYFELCISK